MKRWLTLTALRFGIAILAVAVVFVIFVLVPQRRAKEIIRSQLSLSLQVNSELAAAQAAIASIPDLDQVKLRQLGQMKSYADTFEIAASKLQYLNMFKTSAPKLIFGFGIGNNSHLVRDVNALSAKLMSQNPYQTAADEVTTATNLLAYQAKVARALVNLLEYDPVIDNKNFSLGSSDSQQRLQLAQNGLNKAKQDLETAQNTGLDNTLGTVLGLIENLQAAHARWAQTGDSRAWINSVETAQAKIVANRTAFWRGASQSSLTRLYAIHADISTINEQWQKLAAAYNVN